MKEKSRKERSVKNVRELLGWESPMDTNHRGAPHGKVGAAFHLLPPEALRRAAKIMQQNLESHGRDTWRSLDRDDHINHLLAHIFDWMEGKNDEDHLAHALCRAMFLASTLAEDKEAVNHD